MNKIKSFRAGCGAAIGWALLFSCSGELRAEARYDGVGRIIVSGAGNTLASIAKDIRKPDVFAYDAQARTADCKAGIAFMGVGGELTLGKKADPGAGETLRIICDPQGEERSRSISVRDAALNVYHSKIIGVTSKITRGKYRFGGIGYEYTGGGELIGSEIHSALMGLQVSTLAPVALVIQDCKCVDCGTGLYLAADQADSVWVDGLDVSRGTEYGVLFRLPTSRPEPLVLRNVNLGDATVIMDTIAGKHGGTTVLFVNTVVKPNRVWFQEGFGVNRIVSAWEQYIRMVDFDAHALPDGKVRCQSLSPAGADISSPVIRMNAAGEAWVPLPVSIITGADKQAREAPVSNRLDAASATTAFKTVSDRWNASDKGGWKLERQNDGSWKSAPIPYKPPADFLAGAPENLCANGEFEAETSPGYADAWSWWKFFEMQPGGWGLMKPGGKLVRFGLDKEVFYEGRKSLTLPPGLAIYHHPPAGIGTEQLFQGKTYTISFYAKSDKPDTKITMWRWGVGNSQVYFTVGTEWQRQHVTLRNLDESGMLCFQNAPVSAFDLPDETLAAQGRLWLDAVQIEEGEQLTPFMPSNYVCPER